MRTVWNSPLYRGATIALFLSGLGTSAAAPQITLFLVDDLHVSLTTAGLYYLTNITAPVAGYLIGARSDRTGSRLGLFRLCALAGFLGWCAMAAATQVWMPFVISALVLAFAGAAGSQLFAAVHDDLQATGEPGRRRRRLDRADGADGRLDRRPGRGLAAGHRRRPAGDVRGHRRVHPGADRPDGRSRARPTRARPTGPSATQVAVRGHRPGARARRPGRRVMPPLLVFTGLYVLVYAGEPIKYGYLTIYMHDDLHLPTAVSGAVIGIQPLIELILMPVAVVVARRIGMMRLMVVGAAFGVGANLCFALTGNAAGMFAGQILMGGVWGVFAGLGIIVAQRLLPQAVATASAIFMSSTAIATALGGLTGSVGVDLFGLPHVFLAPALYGLIATVGIAVMSRSRHGVR